MALSLDLNSEDYPEDDNSILKHSLHFDRKCSCNCDITCEKKIKEIIKKGGEFITKIDIKCDCKKCKHLLYYLDEDEDECIYSNPIFITDEAVQVLNIKDIKELNDVEKRAEFFFICLIILKSRYFFVKKSFNLLSMQAINLYRTKQYACALHENLCDFWKKIEGDKSKINFVIEEIQKFRNYLSKEKQRKLKFF